MKFSNKNDYGNEIEYSVPEGSDLDDVLDSFVDFLRGCGYNIDYSKCLAIVNPEVFADSVIKDAEQDLDPEDDEEIVRRPDEPYWDYMARKLRHMARRLRQISKDSGDRWDVE
jgi:hypothetical protein